MKTIYEMSAAELREIAKAKNMSGAWKAKKSEMIAFLEGIGYNTPRIDQNEPELTKEPQTDNYKDENKEALKLAQEPKKNNCWEKIAQENIKNAFNWIVGERENTVSDGDMTQEEFNEWIMNSAVDEVYHEAITTKYHEDACGGPAPTEMRFAGKEFCYEYLMKLFRRDGYPNASHEPQNGPDLTKEARSDNYKTETENAPERTVGLKGYAAWVVDRETKEITTVVGEAESREKFYQSIKGKHRVRLITKPEKIEEECKQWEIRHAQNKIKKNEKYAADKIEATKMNMNVAEYRKWLRAFNSQ